MARIDFFMSANKQSWKLCGIKCVKELSSHPIWLLKWPQQVGNLDDPEGKASKLSVGIPACLLRGPGRDSNHSAGVRPPQCPGAASGRVP